MESLRTDPINYAWSNLRHSTQTTLGRGTFLILKRIAKAEHLPGISCLLETEGCSENRKHLEVTFSGAKESGRKDKLALNRKEERPARFMAYCDPIGFDSTYFSKKLALHNGRP